MQDNMDKQQLAKEILKKYNLTGYVPQEKQSVDLSSRFAEIDALANGETTETGVKKKTLSEKVLDFTGGKEIAQGLGQAIAQPQVAKQLEETQASQIKIQTDLLNKIKENKAQGLDTSRLENALAMITEDIQATGQGAEAQLNPNELTTKQVLGDALQLGTTIVGAGTIPSATKTIVAPTSFVKGAIQGAKTGAITGAGFGGATGISQGLQEDKDLKEIAKQGVRSAIGGGITGGILGGIVGGTSGAIKGAKLKKQEAYLDAITPDTRDLTPTEYEQLLNQGKITPKTGTKRPQYILTDTEKQVAKKYKDLFTNDPVKNTQNLIDEIVKKDKEVGVFLKKNNGIFNTGELKNSLAQKLESIDDLTIDEKRLSKLKKATIDNFIKGLDKNDMETLWKTRKAFDKQIEKSFSGSPTLSNTIKKEFRNAIQDFIAERTPDNTYKTFMKDMTELFNLKDVTNQKAIKEKGMNAVQVWMKRNPTKTKVIGGAIGTGIVGTGLASIIND